MSDTKKYLSLERLQQYNELLKDKIAEDDALVLETAKEYVDGQIESHVHSWNDLEDKPTEISGGYTFENTGSASSNFGFTKVSDIVLTLEDFANGYTVTLETGEVKEYTADDIIVGSYMMLSNDNLIRCKDEYIFSLPEPFKLPNGTTLTAGTYFHTPSTTHTVTIRGEEKLKEDFIPESIARVKDLSNVLATASAAQATANSAQSAANQAKIQASTALGLANSNKAYIGTIPNGSSATTVVDYIISKTVSIEDSLTGVRLNIDSISDRVSKNETDIANIAADYLKAADKTELEGKITAVETAVSTEKSRAEGVEGGLDTRLKAVEDDYLVAADKEALQNQINTIMNNPDAEGAINSINEFTQYVKDHGTIADGFRTDIDKNKEDIAAEVKRAGEAEVALAGRLDKLEAIDHDAYVDADSALKTELTTEIGKKADASVVSDMETAYKAADTELSGKISALEAKFGEGEGSVNDLISDAIDAEELRVDAELAKKVDKVDGKGLSTNDLTDALKGNYDAAYAHSQVAHAPADAQANVIESVKVNGTALTVTGKAVDIAVPTDNAELTNGAGYLVAADIANKADKATTLAGYGIADAYTNAQTDTAIANAMAQFVECSEEEVAALFA